MSRKLRISCQAIVIVLVLTGSPLAQSPTDSDRARKAALGMLHSRETIPAPLDLPGPERIVRRPLEKEHN